MRLPQLLEDPTNIDFDQVKQMVDSTILTQVLFIIMDIAKTLLKNI